MGNPWEAISLSDYESHMKLDSVMQLQALNEIMREQLQAYPVASVMILGVAGGNGLEHVPKDRLQRMYAVDVNRAYLKETARRHPELAGILECLHVDLLGTTDRLPRADLIIADLLIEYIGYVCFQRAVQHTDPRYVSCVIQINAGDAWVSDSPYRCAFDGLEPVHRQIRERELTQAMAAIGFRTIENREQLLPNAKRLMRLDYGRLLDGEMPAFAASPPGAARRRISERGPLSALP